MSPKFFYFMTSNAPNNSINTNVLTHFNSANPCQHSVSSSLNTSHRCLYSVEKFKNFHQDIKKLSLEVCGLTSLLKSKVIITKQMAQTGTRGFRDHSKYTN